MKKIIRQAIKNKQKNLSEYDSKRIIEQAGIPIARQGFARNRKNALVLAQAIGYPVVMKGCGDELAHKTEKGLVKIDIQTPSEAAAVYEELTAKGTSMEGVLVMEMIKGDREFVVGLGRDIQFGPYVMFGVGGIFTEALNDVSFRVAPLKKFDAEDMINEIKAQKLLGPFRGQPAIDRKALVAILIQLGQLGVANNEIAEIDINPLIDRGNRLIAVDALVVLG